MSSAFPVLSCQGAVVREKLGSVVVNVIEASSFSGVNGDGSNVVDDFSDNSSISFS